MLIFTKWSSILQVHSGYTKGRDVRVAACDTRWDTLAREEPCLDGMGRPFSCVNASADEFQPCAAIVWNSVSIEEGITTRVPVHIGITVRSLQGYGLIGAIDRTARTGIARDDVGATSVDAFDNVWLTVSTCVGKQPLSRNYLPTSEV
jgi:hypothetical protein